MAKFLTICLLICSTLFFLITSILIVSRITFDFSVQAAPYDMVAISGLSEAELKYAFDDTVHYLYDDREVLDTTIAETPLFNQKEIRHMREVKMIFQFLITFFWLSLATLLLLLTYWIRRVKAQLTQRWLLKTIRIYFFSVFGFFALIGLLITFFFEPLFLGFHQIVFQNDDWLLSLYSDHLIQFLPEQFFFKRAIQIALLFICLHTTTTYILPSLYQRKNQRN